MSVELPFNKKPNSWKTITDTDTEKSLQFAINQLEESKKPYSIERNLKNWKRQKQMGQMICLWSKTFV